VDPTNAEMVTRCTLAHVLGLGSCFRRATRRCSGRRPLRGSAPLPLSARVVRSTSSTLE
jgi:hypothetical protein